MFEALGSLDLSAIDIETIKGQLSFLGEELPPWVDKLLVQAQNRKSTPSKKKSKNKTSNK